ncbi:MAG TPA: hypothetical protein VMT03_13390 [Polyangia bacterium]|nr:hypothetical protein [Polyangia bacterium]
MAGLAGCQQADLGTAGCRITQQSTFAGSPLTLLSTARLDAVGSGYVLIGADASAVRWASVSDKGGLGAEHAFGLPMGATSPLFAVAGSSSTSPGDTVLVGWLGPDPTGKKGDLSMIALPADGTPPMGPAAVIHEFPGGVPAAGTVVMVSSRQGTNAGLAWADPALGQVLFAAVDAQGALVGATTPTAPTSGPFDCLSFQPGKDDLTLVYHATLTSQNSVGWVIVEANEDGGVDSYTTLGYTGAYAYCASVAPTATGYGIAWQDSAGAWLGIAVAGATTLPAAAPFAPASGFGGAYLQPPIVAIASFQQDFGVLFKRLNDAELWRIDQMGNRRSGALILPSAQGHLDGVSTTLAAGAGGPAAGSPLAITYADYTGTTAGPDGGTVPTGNRIFLNAACY